MCVILKDSKNKNLKQNFVKFSKGIPKIFLDIGIFGLFSGQRRSDNLFHRRCNSFKKTQISEFGCRPIMHFWCILIEWLLYYLTNNHTNNIPDNSYRHFFTEFQLYWTYSQTSGAIIVNNELQIIMKLLSDYPSCWKRKQIIY